MDLLMIARHLNEALESMSKAHRQGFYAAREGLAPQPHEDVINGVSMHAMQDQLLDLNGELAACVDRLKIMLHRAMRAADIGDEDPRLLAVCPACEGTCRTPFQDHARVSMAGTQHYTTGGEDCRCCKGKGMVPVTEWIADEGSITTEHQEDGACCAGED